MFKEWNRAFDKLRHQHDTWYIFRDWLDMTIDQFTIPDQKPLFQNPDKYTPKEYEWFGEMFTAYIQTMNKELEHRPYFDFLGEWWEGDVNMTNKFKAQFFTPTDVCDLMVDLTVTDDLGDEVLVMNDPCCGSGRFALAYHIRRPGDWFKLADLDNYACKMTLLNMVCHGMRGVVAHMNTLTREVFSCWQVSPYSFGGVPYIVPYDSDLRGACMCLPRGNGDGVSMPSVNENTIDEACTTDEDSTNDTPVTSKEGLDAWL